MKTRFFLLGLTPFLLALHAPAQDADPFLWLEDINGDQAMKWVLDRNKATLDDITKHPEFDNLVKKNLEVLDSDERIAFPTLMGDVVYNFWQDKNNERGVWRRTTLNEYRKASPVWETVLDIDDLSKADGKKWSYRGVSWLYPDFSRCLVRLSEGGRDAAEAREFDPVTRTFVKDGFYLEPARSTVSWKDRNTLYVSTDFGPGSMTTSGYPRIVKLWSRGTPLSAAKTIFEADTTDLGAFVNIIRTRDQAYEIIARAKDFFHSEFFAIVGEEPVKLDLPEEMEFDFMMNQLILYLKTDWTTGGTTYAQGSLIGIDYDRFLKGGRDFQIIVKPEDRSSVQSFSATASLLLVNVLTNVKNELYQYEFLNGSWRGKKVDAPVFGTINIAVADWKTDRYFFSYQGFLDPTGLYYVASGSSQPQKLKGQPEFFDDTGFTVEQYEATSRDGTRVPYFLIRGKNVEYNGKNPTLQYGYGGFEISQRPSYSGTVGRSWLEYGGVYVVANIRGGGEFGPQWHKAALKENRQRAYDDFIGVAEDLIKRKVTSPEHLGIMGGSNGGLLMGAMVTQRPDLFKAVVCSAPLLDMKRYTKLLVGASWMGEYGDPDKPEEWAFIKKYSPYQNLKPGMKYPRVLFTTTTADDRVHPGHARKMAALMEKMGYPVYFFEDTEGGHAGASTNQQRAKRSALIYSYLLKELR